MTAKVDRRTVDLSGYPDLVVIYLGMRVNTLAGLKTLIGFGPTRAALDSGTKPISCAAAWKLSTTAWCRTRAFFVLRRCNRLDEACSLLEVGPNTLANH
jgi:hypothetical protein